VATYAPDGIILASDSRTTFVRGPHHRVATDYARKLFVPCKGIGLACFGSALVGRETIAGLVEKLIAERRIKDHSTPAEASAAVVNFFSPRLEEYSRTSDVKIPPRLYGFLVAGYEEGVGRVSEVLLPKNAHGKTIVEHDFSTLDEGAAIFRGRTRYIRRMLAGYDRYLMREAKIEFPDETVERLKQVRYILKRTISVQDALDLATFIVRMTIDMERLTDGTIGQPGDSPRCGGSIQALLVTRNETVWISEAPLKIRIQGLAELD